MPKSDIIGNCDVLIPIIMITLLLRYTILLIYMHTYVHVCMHSIPLLSDVDLFLFPLSLVLLVGLAKLNYKIAL